MTSETMMFSKRLGEKNFSIPVFTTRAGGELGGTAFIVHSDSGTLYLVTCAHAATVSQVSSKRWAEWTDHLTAYMEISPKNFVSDEVRLFDLDPSGIRTPRFLYVNHPHTPDSIVDLIMIPLRHDWPLLRGYEVIDLKRTSAPGIGETITAKGFPTAVPQWPMIEGTNGPTISATANSASLLVVDMKSSEGFSGAPAFKSDGAFVGMVAGMTVDSHEYAQLIPLGFLLAARPHAGGRLYGPYFPCY